MKLPTPTPARGFQLRVRTIGHFGSIPEALERLDVAGKILLVPAAEGPNIATRQRLASDFRVSNTDAAMQAMYAFHTDTIQKMRAVQQDLRPRLSVTSIHNFYSLIHHLSDPTNDSRRAVEYAFELMKLPPPLGESALHTIIHDVVENSSPDFVMQPQRG